jgi:CheY-like chemotaxis protein
MHDGKVTAASAGPGMGSTFEIRLPLITHVAVPVTTHATHSVVPKRVLVVDDNEDAAMSLAEFLRLDGHESLAVYGAREALHAVATFKPEVVLLDIGLPELDGYEVAQRLRASGSTVRLIALTGYGQAEDIQRTRAAGFDAHLVKPVDFAVLERLVAEKPAAANQPLASSRHPAA